MTTHPTKSLFVWLTALVAATALTGCLGDGGSGLPTDTMDATGDAAQDEDTAQPSDTADEDSAATDAAQDTGANDTTTTTDTGGQDTTGEETSVEDATVEDTSTSDTASADTITTDAVDTAPDVLMCETGTDDCDGDPSNGCEPLDTLDDCGACGASCELVNATASCESGACELVMCDENTGDCDGDPTNGCEDDWGPAGGACCAGGGVQLDITGLSVGNPDQGTWAIYKNGSALVEDLHCGSDWNRLDVQYALDAANRPVDLVWRRNCYGGSWDVEGWWDSGGAARDAAFIVFDENGGELVRILAQLELASYANVPAGSTCTAAVQVTFRVL